MSKVATVQEINEAFSMMNSLARDVIYGETAKNLVIVAGPGGIGKTFGLEQLLKQYDKSYDAASGKGNLVERFTSKISGPQLHEVYYDARKKGRIVFFDDCKIEGDEDVLNKLKAATDTRPVRQMSHRVTKRGGDSDTPSTFGCEAITIIATNVNYDQKIQFAGKGKAQSAQAEHLKAMITRARFINLFKVFQTMEDCVIRLKQLIDGGMLASHPEQVRKDVFNYIRKNTRGDVCRIRELSGRMVLELADLRHQYGVNWEKFADFATFD